VLGFSREAISSNRLSQRSSCVMADCHHLTSDRRTPSLVTMEVSLFKPSSKVHSAVDHSYGSVLMDAGSKLGMVRPTNSCIELISSVCRE
jgi:hypothetical protein